MLQTCGNTPTPTDLRHKLTHTKEQPGLHAHSWRPEDDLMKRYEVRVSTNPKFGFMAVSSFNHSENAVRDGYKRADAVKGKHVYSVFIVVDTQPGFRDNEECVWRFVL